MRNQRTQQVKRAGITGRRAAEKAGRRLRVRMRAKVCVPEFMSRAFLFRIGRSHANQHSPRPIMSNVASPSTSRSNLDVIFKAALRTYKKNTGKDITSHPLAAELQLCDSPDAILAVLRRQLPTPDQSKKPHETFEKCLIPTVNVLYTLSGTLGGVAGLVIIMTSSLLRICVQTSFLQIFPPANIIFTGIGALLLVG